MKVVLIIGALIFSRIDLNMLFSYGKNISEKARNSNIAKKLILIGIQRAIRPSLTLTSQLSV